MTCIIAETALALASQIEEAGAGRGKFADAMERLGIWMTEDDPEFATTVEAMFESTCGLIAAEDIAGRVAPALRIEATALRRACEGQPHDLCSPMG